MNPELIAQIKLECLRIAGKFSKTTEELINNSIKLQDFVLTFIPNENCG